MNKQSKEPYKFQLPTRLKLITFRITAEAMLLLSGATGNRCGDKVSNTILFYDLLSRMAVNAKVSNDFRRPLALQPGQAKYSELRLSEQWQMNRTRMRNLLDRMEEAGLIYTDRSLVGSVMTFPSVLGWSARTSLIYATPSFSVLIELPAAETVNLPNCGLPHG